MDLTYEQRKEWLKTEDAEIARRKLLEIRNMEDIEMAFAKMVEIEKSDSEEKDKFLYLDEYSGTLKHVVYKFKDFKEQQNL